MRLLGKVISSPFLNNSILQTLGCYKVFLIPEEFFLIRLAGKPTI